MGARKKNTAFSNGSETMEERRQRFSRIWVESRKEQGKTQEFMAEGLGVSKRTVQNWENGVTAPDLFIGSEWFRVLGINPLPYYLSFLFPDMFDGIAPEDKDDEIEQALISFIRNSTAAEKRELLYVIAGCHGSSWYSLLQMFTAHCHTSLQSRVNAARLILDNYEMDECTDMLVCPDNVRPDLKMLRSAVEEGKRAVAGKKSGYTSIHAEAGKTGEE